MKQYSVCHPLTIWKICTTNKWFINDETYKKIFDANENGAEIEEIAKIIFLNSNAPSYEYVFKKLQLAQTDYLNDSLSHEKKNTVTRAWKICGTVGSRQAVSFRNSFRWDFSKPNRPRIIECECSDKTSTNDYVIIRITRESSQACFLELWGQLNDGIFANVHTGKIEEIV